MENISDLCIFCAKPLTGEEKKGKGDHVVPKYLYGSVCIKDVCKLCNNRLGSVADFLALEDKRIINAAFSLNLPELHNKIRDRGSGKLVDTDSGYEIPVTCKNGRPRAVRQQLSDRIIGCDESDTEKMIMDMLKKKPPASLSPQEAQDIGRKLLFDNGRLKPGESVYEPRLNIGLRKAPAILKFEPKITPKACDRLVAKIGYEVSFLLFYGNRDRWVCMYTLDKLLAVALGNGNLDQSILMYPLDLFSPVNHSPQGPNYFHQIILWCENYGNVIDIYIYISLVVLAFAFYCAKITNPVMGQFRFMMAVPMPRCLASS